MLIIPLIGMYLQLHGFSSKEVLLSAYHEGVISGADILFYKDGTMIYESNSLIGTQVFNGIYELRDDTFNVTYLSEIPSLKYTMMTKSDKKLLFLNNEKEVSYKFYLDKEFGD